MAEPKMIVGYDHLGEPIYEMEQETVESITAPIEGVTIAGFTEDEIARTWGASEDGE